MTIANSGDCSSRMLQVEFVPRGATECRSHRQERGLLSFQLDNKAIIGELRCLPFILRDVMWRNRVCFGGEYSRKNRVDQEAVRSAEGLVGWGLRGDQGIGLWEDVGRRGEEDGQSQSN